MIAVLVVAEIDRGRLRPNTFEALAAARRLDGDAEVTTLLCGPLDDQDEAAAALARSGSKAVRQARHPMLSDYGPEAWGATVAQTIEELEPSVALACGTGRGNEVLAQAAARLDLPFVANCVDLGADGRRPTRLQWGGSLLETVAVEAETLLLSVAPFTFDPEAADGSAPDQSGLAASFDPPTWETVEPDLDPTVARTICVGREVAEAGVTLATAPVVFGGGRGVGSAEGFEVLERVAELLGGRVGCSRAVTNNGWRPHQDQIGQTGTRIAPDLYVASGISGAIQHWIGAAAAKKVLAINTDPDANMVTKSDYHVIGDLHEVLPAVVAELEARRGSAGQDGN